MVVCVYVDACESGCVSTIHPPPYSISASVHHQEGEDDRRFFIVYRIGILWVSVLHEWETRGKKTQWSREENHFNWRPQVSEYSQVWFAYICEQLLLFYQHKQNNSDSHDAPTANDVFCVISTLPMNALCILR